jgi:hypothetical protein
MNALRRSQMTLVRGIELWPGWAVRYGGNTALKAELDNGNNAESWCRKASCFFKRKGFRRKRTDEALIPGVQQSGQ